MVPIHGGVKTELEEPKRLGLRPSGPGIPKELGTEGASRLRQILSERIDYVHDPSFERGPTSRAFAGKWTKSALDRGRNCMSSAGRHAATFVAGNTLTMNEERRLFLRFNYARYRIAGILKRFADQPLTARAARELLEWHTESLALRDLLVEMNMPLVLAMAKRARLGNVDFMDLVSEGNIALLHSVRKFDCSRGYKFSTYACRAILTSFCRVAKQTNRHRARFPRQFDPRLGLGDHHAGEREDFASDAVDQIRNILRENSAALSDVETTVIRGRFRLASENGTAADAPKTLEQVGLLIGVSKERARQIQNRALAKLRLKLLEDSITR